MAISMAKPTRRMSSFSILKCRERDGITALPELLKVAPRNQKSLWSDAIASRNAAASACRRAVDWCRIISLKPSASLVSEVDIFYREIIETKALGGLQRAWPCFACTCCNKSGSASGFWKFGWKNPLRQFYTRRTCVTCLNLFRLHRPPRRCMSLVLALAIASSTAARFVFEQLKGRLPNMPIFITQHMPPTFTTTAAHHQSQAAFAPVGKDGEVVCFRRVYLAPGDYHMVPESRNGSVSHTNQGPQENYCRPAADPTPRAPSGIYGKNLAVVVLTGMGKTQGVGRKSSSEAGGTRLRRMKPAALFAWNAKSRCGEWIMSSNLPLPER